MAKLMQSGIAGKGRATPKAAPKATRMKLPTPTKVGSTKKGKTFQKAGTSDSKSLGIKGMGHVAAGMRASSQARPVSTHRRMKPKK